MEIAIWLGTQLPHTKSGSVRKGEQTSAEHPAASAPFLSSWSFQPGGKTDTKYFNMWLQIVMLL